MLTPTNDRQRLGSDHGFTLPEVMVTILIVGVLLAAGVPTYRGARDRANDSAARAALHDGLVTAWIIYIDDLDFDDADGAGMATGEPSMTFIDAPGVSASGEQLSVATGAGGSTWGAAVMSDSGTCFYVRTNGTDATVYGSSTSLACSGTAALTIPG